jgi:hypothetical protein
MPSSPSPWLRVSAVSRHSAEAVGAYGRIQGEGTRPIRPRVAAAAVATCPRAGELPARWCASPVGTE